MKAAIYCRLSEEDKNKSLKTEDSGSIQNQKSMLIRYAMDRGWEIYGIYSDDDYAGADRKRPAFNRLLADAEMRCFDIILCKTQSRFTREMELVEKYIHGLFPLWGIRFVSIVDNADTNNRGNKKSRQINGLINEWYLEDMSENIRSVLTSRRQNGLHIGSFALYGYKKDPDKKGHLLIDPEAAAVVREIFHLFADGYGKTAIARRLNERGIPNPTEYKRQQGLHYKQPNTPAAALWKYSAVAAILKNEMYLGHMVQGKYGSVSYKTKENRPRPRDSWYVVADTHEPIIDRALWEQVQARLAENAKPFGTGTVGLFAGKAYCAHCGYALRSSQSHGKRYLSCPTRYVAKDACEGAFVSEKRLEEAILRGIREWNAQYLSREKLTSALLPTKDRENEKRQWKNELSALKKQIHEKEETLRALYADKVKGILNEEEFIHFSKAFSEEKEVLQTRINTAEKELSEASAFSEEKSSEDRIADYVDSPHLTRAVVDTLVDRITVGKRMPGTRNVPLQIFWTF